MVLLSKSAEAVYEGSFVAHLLYELLYYQAPVWVFAVCYTVFWGRWLYLVGFGRGETSVALSAAPWHDMRMRLRLMFARLDQFLLQRSGNQITLIAALLVLIIASIDWQTGNELSFSIFYTIAIGIGTWYSGRRLGYQLCCVCACTWFAVDGLAGSLYSHIGTQIWNAGVRFGFFVIISTLLSRLRFELDAQAGFARRDLLTGILNLRGFKEDSGALFMLAGRHGRAITLGYLDLDGFKAINDNLGHGTGDQVIRAIATALETHMRASDRCARIGGDEFAILLPETDLAGAQVFFTGLKIRLTELVAQRGWPVGFSFGVLVLDPPTVDIDEAIQQADQLMYNVKKTGKNNILFRSATAPDGTI